jgi:CelD/BcsL family acetyltransferase involved in cellulose biosynthesis
VLHLDGHPAAAVLNLRFAGREIGFMSGRDPNFDADYVGLEVLFHAIEQASVDGMTEFEMLRGDQPYKARLAHRTRMVDDLVLSRGAAGTLTIAAQRARGELQRRWQEGRSPRGVVERVLRAGGRNGARSTRGPGGPSTGGFGRVDRPVRTGHQ